jgi:hypothetical protein
MGKAKLIHMVYELTGKQNQPLIPENAEVVGIRLNIQGNAGQINYDFKSKNYPAGSHSEWLENRARTYMNERKYTPQERKEIFEYLKGK